MDMKFARFFCKVFAIIIPATLATGCMTTYDAYGRPVQSVDPGLAIAGAAAAGLVGYAIGNQNSYCNNGGRYYGGGGYYGGGYRSGYAYRNSGRGYYARPGYRCY